MFMVSSRGMLVNNEVMSRLAIKQSEFCCSISLAKSNESLTLYLLEVKSLSIGTRNLVTSYVGVPLTERIGRIAGEPLITFLWTFAGPFSRHFARLFVALRHCYALQSPLISDY